MSEHERERLSGYLDGELPAAERAAVERHLAGCAECKARLAELAAVDEAAAGLETAEPAGYFDDFAARVRARLEAAPAVRRPEKRLAWRMPAWAWAAAAALLLAVVTPLTWREQRSVDTAARATASRPPAPAAASPLPALPPVATRAPGGAGGTARGDEALHAERDRRRQEAQPLQSGAVPAAQAAAPAAAPSASALTEDTLDRGRSAEPGASGAVAAAPAAVEQKRASLLADAQPAPAAGARETSATPQDQDAPRKAEAPRSASVARRGTLLKAPASAARAGETAEGGTAAANLAGEEEDGFARLAAERPETAADWRRLSEAWSALASGAPQAGRADEARVRAIEAAHEAYRVGGDARDAGSVRRLVAAYLARSDARQRERVKALSEVLPR